MERWISEGTQIMAYKYGNFVVGETASGATA
jgi:hypothetical protein